MDSLLPLRMTFPVLKPPSQVELGNEYFLQSSTLEL